MEANVIPKTEAPQLKRGGRPPVAEIQTIRRTVESLTPETVATFTFPDVATAKRRATNIRSLLSRLGLARGKTHCWIQENTVYVSLNEDA